MNYNLENKTILVTGANGQLGLSLVDNLVKQSVNVIATDVKSDNILRLIKKRNWNSKKILFFKCDLQEEKQVKNLFKSLKYKIVSLDALVCNAGVAVFEHFLERKTSSFDKVVNVNMRGLFYFIREFIKYKKNSKKKSVIVNVASHYGLVAPDLSIYTDTKRMSSEVYGASKAAIIQMTRYFAVNAVKYGIRTNSISPGGIKDDENPLGNKATQKIKQGLNFRKRYNDRCPMRRLAKVQEVVDPILFLLSPASSYINGHNIVVDGGYTAW